MTLSPLARQLAERVQKTPALRKELAQRLSLHSPETLEAWIHGARPIPLDSLPTLCAGLGLSAAEMLIKELEFRHPSLRECLGELQRLCGAVEQEIRNLLVE